MKQKKTELERLDRMQAEIGDEIHEERYLKDADLVGWTIVKCDDERCATCTQESFGCKKLTMPGGQVCIWE